MTRILIVDDNMQNRYLLESIFKGYAFEVISAGNGKEALTLAYRNPPDLVISDILMPVMDGFTLCRLWKADERLATIPFIFYTATYTDPRDERFALSLGAERFVVKPQKPEVLAAIVREVLEQGHAKALRAPAPDSAEETEMLRQYNEVLFRKLEKKVQELEAENAERKLAEEKIRLATNKLALMTDITYQDISNKVTAAWGLAELIRKQPDEEARNALIERQKDVLETMHVLIQKTKEYQQMGVHGSCWVPLEKVIRLQFAHLTGKDAVELAMDLHGLEVFADPLIDRVFFMLMHNSLRHGRTVTRISITCQETPGGVVVTCGDNGVGIAPERKETLFERIVGGAGSFGLFFVREFLDLSGMTIRENGVPKKGARFEIAIPKGLYRFAVP